jgi:hypothetical protein
MVTGTFAVTIFFYDSDLWWIPSLLWSQSRIEPIVRSAQGSKPKTTTLFGVPTYTFPFATIGVTYLLSLK